MRILPLLAFLLSVPAVAHAADPLVVAADPGASPLPNVAPASSPTIAAPSPVARPFTPNDEAAREPRVREGVDLGGSLYLLSATAIDDFRQAGLLLRPQLELYASFGLGDVSLLLGGTVLGVEGVFSGERQSVAFPALATLGFRSDDYMVMLAGGASLGSDNFYGDDIDDHEVSLPSPRGEVRVGVRFDDFAEIQGIIGVERRLYENRENETRAFLGVSVGFGGDG